MPVWLELLSHPVALVAWGLLALVWLSRRGGVPRAARWLVAGLAVIYFALATPLGANLVVGALERPSRPVAQACLEPPPGGTIVVLAGGMSEHVPSKDDHASLHAPTLRRVMEGVKLARSARDARLVLAGGGGGAVREADVMASLATALGFPPARLVLERQSRTTAEGAVQVARLLAEGGAPPPAVHLVTSALHMPRAAASFRRQGLEVCPVPVDRRYVRPAVHELLIPQLTALEKSSDAYHEIVGYAVYWATGRL